MQSKWQWLLSQLTRTLWLRASLVGLLGVLVALLALPAQNLISKPIPFEIGSNAVDTILQILATSMLTVTIFSLSVMVSAYNAASSGVTPRATTLIKQDPTTQNVLATFLGSFLFSLVGIIALSTNLYGEEGRFILFIATLAVIFWIVIALLRWIEHLSELGRVSNTTNQVEKKVQEALDERIKVPSLGGHPIKDPGKLPDNAIEVFVHKLGYVQHVDVTSLAQLSEDNDVEIGVLALPGTLTHPGKSVAWYIGQLEESCIETIRNAFTIDMERSYDQDPRFGFSVLAEIASRALSPAVNDPGTAIEVINRLTRLFLAFKGQDAKVEPENILHDRLHVATLSLQDMLEDGFLPIARDGAAVLEVQLRLQKALRTLKENEPGLFSQGVQHISSLALEYAEKSDMLEAEKQRLRELVDQIND